LRQFLNRSGQTYKKGDPKMNNRSIEYSLGPPCGRPFLHGSGLGCVSHLGLEGIVSKGRDPFYRSGRSPDWIKSKNPNAPAAKREIEEDWSRR
jgi:hypothetical protein